MSILGKTEIIKYLKKKSLDERLIVTPILDFDQQIGDSSIDLRLGNDFIITRKGNLASVDPAESNFQKHRCQAKHHTNFYDKFYLHPGEFVLAGTLEYIRLPKTLAGFVTSRSKWGRAGLVIATAIAIAPGFTGCITLELNNMGEVPLVLYPGLRVSQIVLEECIGGSTYSGQLSCLTGPQYGDVSKDEDVKRFVNRSEQDHTQD